MNLYPLSFEPHYVPKIWGGSRLQTQLGKTLPPGEKIGESWEIFDRGEKSAVVDDGPLKGHSLGDLVKEFGPRLLGQKQYALSPDRFPLLFKIIDANDWLSVQVHPDDDYAALRVDPDESGKTEMWYLLDAAADSEVVSGLKKGVDRAAYQTALKTGKIKSILNRFSVKKGDAVFIPAGRVHAIGSGCFIAEIQQNSDITYRVYDYDRLENGKKRELHLKQALETIHFDGPERALAELQDLVKTQGDGWKSRKLTACEHFRVFELQVDGEFRDLKAREGFHVLMGLKGNGTLKAAGCAEKTLAPGRCLLMPASLDWSLQGSCELLWIRSGV